MEVIIFIIVVILLNSIGGKNKKKGAQQGQAQARKQAVAQPKRGMAASGTMPKDAFAPKAQPTPASSKTKKTLIEQERACAEKPMHLHEVTQAQMQAAGEGEDPCHRGGVGPVAERKRKIAAAGTPVRSASPVYASPFDEEEDERRERLRQDVLRGVVMSEILMTPSQRQALRRAEAEGRTRRWTTT